jgi:hypothetical protein
VYRFNVHIGWRNEINFDATLDYRYGYAIMVASQVQYIRRQVLSNPGGDDPTGIEIFGQTVCCMQNSPSGIDSPS